jgi:hypothetical protein
VNFRLIPASLFDADEADRLGKYWNPKRSKSRSVILAVNRRVNITASVNGDSVADGS